MNKYDEYTSGFAPSNPANNNPKGNLTEVRDSSGTTWFYYDNRNRLYKKMVHIKGFADTLKIYYSYNNADQLTGLTYPDSSKVEYRYNAAGQLISIPDFLEHSDTTRPAITYEPWGGLESITYFGDSLYTTVYEYDSLYQVRKTYAKHNTAKIWGQTYEYDAVGNVLRNIGLNSNGSVNNSDTLGVYAYDYNYQLIQARVKSGAVEKEYKYGYDNSGNMTYNGEVPGDSINYSYYLNPVDIEYEKVTWASAGTNYAPDYSNLYDSTSFYPENNIDTIYWETIDGHAGGFDFTIFSEESTYVNTRGPHSGFFIPLSTERLDIVLTQDDMCDPGWDECGAYGHLFYYIIDTTHTEWDVTNRLNHITGQSLSNYVCDSAGRLIADSSASKAYTYDDLGRLATYSKDGTDRLKFIYNHVGQRVMKLTYNSHYCEHPDTVSPSADDVCDEITPGLCNCTPGNMAGYVPGDANKSCTFTGQDVTFMTNYFRGVIDSIAAPMSRADANCDGSIIGSDITVMVRHFQGLDTVKCCFWQVEPETTYYVYSGSEMIAEYGPGGVLEWNYVNGLGQRLARFNDSKQQDARQIYHTDHLGSMRAITNEAGAILARVDYEPFGQQLSVAGTPGAHTYTGKEYDDEWEFDLYYYGARYMDPALGRFISPDPINDFLNPYSYVGNNPMNRIDPTGMLDEPAVQFIWQNPDAIKAKDLGQLGDHRDPFLVAMAKMQNEKLEQEKLQKKLLKELFEKASEAAFHMIGTTEDQSTQKEWEKNSEMLKYLADHMDEFLDKKIIIKDLGSAKALVDPRRVGDNGLVSSKQASLLLDKALFSNPNTSDLGLIGILIHEAAHLVFMDRFHDMDKDDFHVFGADNSYVVATEANAYAREYDFYAQNLDAFSESSLNYNKGKSWAEGDEHFREEMLVSAIQNSLVASALGF